MTANPSAGIEPNVARTDAYGAFGKALRLYVGRGCRYSYKDLQRKSGVCARMIEAYRYSPGHEEWRAAPFEDILSLSGAIGPEFTADWLRLTGQGAFWLPEGDVPPGAIAADAAEDTAVIARAAANGEFEPHEKPDLHVVAQRMIVNGQRLAAA